MGVKVTNNGFGTLSAGINSSATTVTVDSGQGGRFPTLASGDFFFATLVDTSNNLEIIKVTARSTDSMTVVRAQDNTSARAFSIGDRIELRPTAALFENAHLDNTPTSTGSFGLPKGTTAQQPTASATEGHIRYNTQNNLVYYSDGSNWLKLSAVQVVLSSITGTILNGVATNLTLAGTGFLTASLVVKLTPAGGSTSSVTVTPSSDTAATVAVPSAIYGQSASTVIGISVTNSDGTTSSTVNSTVVAAPSGGTITTSGGERIHTFTSSGTFVNTLALSNVEYLIIAGGGGGGVANGGGGGGGAGGYRNSFDTEASGRNSSTESKISSLAAASYSIVVGGGGAGNVHGGASGGVGVQGSNSSFNSIVSTGGGFGAGDSNQTGGNGGSGGGAARNASNGTRGSGTSGQGFDGGLAAVNDGGGGGGAGAIGGNASSGSGGNGGNGLSSSITGSAVTRAGGGGGGAESPSNDNGGIGGAGGGGKGGQAGSVGSTPTAGTANTGSGGGASGDYNTGGTHNGQNGGSGVVIIRYAV